VALPEHGDDAALFALAEATMSNSPHGPDEIAALRALVEAHAIPDPRSGSREPIWYLPGHDEFMHHALTTENKPDVDSALLQEMNVKGLISIDYSGSNNWKLTPTEHGREVVEEHDRSAGEPGPENEQIVGAVVAQLDHENPLAWQAVRPTLAAIRVCWQAAGYRDFGIALLPAARSMEDDALTLFAATIRALIGAGYLTPGRLSATVTDENGRAGMLPTEVALTEKAHAVLDGWPGAAPTELAENLVAVLAAAIAAEPDPVRKGRLEAFLGAVKEIGVSVTSDVLAKVISGAV
jgi:hypothetical protein